MKFAVTVLLSLMSISCASIERPRAWTGDSERQAVLNHPEQIQCSDPKFNNMVCMSIEDFENLRRDTERGCYWDRGRLWR